MTFLNWWKSRPPIRLTSVSTPVVGITWEYAARAEPGLADQLFTFLRDRRVLFETPRSMEDPVLVLKSVRKMRSWLLTAQMQIKPGNGTYFILARLLDSCKRCQTVLEHPQAQGNGRMNKDQWQALTEMREEFVHALLELRELADQRVADDLIAQVTTGYIAPLFEEAMLYASSSTGSWLPVPACLPAKDGSAQIIDDLIVGHVRVDEEISSDGRIVTKWLTVPYVWPLEFRQPRDWHEVLVGVCFDHGDGADPAQALSKQEIDAELLAELAGPASADQPDDQIFFQQVLAQPIRPVT
jgi:hypothetical protein